MGRNRIPTAMQDTKGAFQKNPQRKRVKEPVSDRGIGNPPSFLSKEEKKVWRELVAESIPGVLTVVDRSIFSKFVRLEAMFRAGVTLKAADNSFMLSVASRYAMTPADRSKVAVEKKQESVLATLLAKRQTASQPAETIQ